MPLLHFLLNGAIVTAAIFLLQVLVNVPAAYALAKRRFRGRDAMFATVLVCLLIPYQAIALPIYILFFSTGILNTYASLVLPFTISVFGIFLMRQFFLGVPDDLIDAARIDGMSEYRHRLGRHGADRHAGAGRLRHLLAGRALERLFLAADRRRRRRASIRRRSASPS